MCPSASHSRAFSYTRKSRLPRSSIDSEECIVLEQYTYIFLYTTYLIAISPLRNSLQSKYFRVEMSILLLLFQSLLVCLCGSKLASDRAGLLGAKSNRKSLALTGELLSEL